MSTPDERRARRRSSGARVALIANIVDTLAEESRREMYASLDKTTLDKTTAKPHTPSGQIETSTEGLVRAASSDHRSEADLANIIAWLHRAAKNTLFKNTDAAAMRTVAQQVQVRTFVEDEILCSQGEIGNAFYVLVSGHLDVHITPNDRRLKEELRLTRQALAKDGLGSSVPGTRRASKLAKIPLFVKRGGAGDGDRANRVLVDLLGNVVVELTKKGQGFGELALMADDRRRNASVVARERSVLLVINRRTYYTTLKDQAQKQFDLKVAFLRDVSLFKGWTKRRLVWLAYSLKHRTLPRKAYLFKRGEKVDGLHFIVSGSCKVIAHAMRQAPPSTLSHQLSRARRVKVSHFSMHQRHQLVDVTLMGPGSVIGEVGAVYKHDRRQMSVVTLEETDVYFLPLSDFDAFIRPMKDYDIMDALIAEAIRILERTDDRMKTLGMMRLDGGGDDLTHPDVCYGVKDSGVSHGAWGALSAAEFKELSDAAEATVGRSGVTRNVSSSVLDSTSAFTSAGLTAEPVTALLRPKAPIVKPIVSVESASTSSPLGSRSPRTLAAQPSGGGSSAVSGSVGASAVSPSRSPTRPPRGRGRKDPLMEVPPPAFKIYSHTLSNSDDAFHRKSQARIREELKKSTTGRRDRVRKERELKLMLKGQLDEYMERNPQVQMESVAKLAGVETKNKFVGRALASVPLAEAGVRSVLSPRRAQNVSLDTWRSANREAVDNTSQVLLHPRGGDGDDGGDGGDGGSPEAITPPGGHPASPTSPARGFSDDTGFTSSAMSPIRTQPGSETARGRLENPSRPKVGTGVRRSSLSLQRRLVAPPSRSSGETGMVELGHGGTMADSSMGKGGNTMTGSFIPASSRTARLAGRGAAPRDAPQRLIQTVTTGISPASIVEARNAAEKDEVVAQIRAAASTASLAHPLAPSRPTKTRGGSRVLGAGNSSADLLNSLIASSASLRGVHEGGGHPGSAHGHDRSSSSTMHRGVWSKRSSRQPSAPPAARIVSQDDIDKAHRAYLRRFRQIAEGPHASLKPVTTLGGGYHAKVSTVAAMRNARLHPRPANILGRAGASAVSPRSPRPHGGRAEPLRS